jgi:hypothetical protein
MYVEVDLRTLPKTPEHEWLFRPGPVPLRMRCDLAICLETAEHLPEPAGVALVRMLCAASPVVLFSAAQPGQGPYPPPGAPEKDLGRWHINEQTPAYWADQFRACGYQQLDVIRPRFGEDMRVLPWYRTNTYVYVEGE